MIDYCKEITKERRNDEYRAVKRVDEPTSRWPQGYEWWELQVKKNKYFKPVIWGYVCDDMDTIHSFDSKEECEDFIKDIKAGKVEFIAKGVIFNGFSDG